MGLSSPPMGPSSPMNLLILKDTSKLVKWSGVRTQHSTTPFVDDMYERLKETLTDYEVIIFRWPEYTLVLENFLGSLDCWRSLNVVNNSLEMAQLAMEDILTQLKKEMVAPWRTYLGSNCIFVVCNIRVNALWIHPS
ncbi:hypothetical protein JHK85_019235 [Glycine max]|nr:hypothetical protein JHK85_019235 [Glycine max]KAG5037971.1 hypothetical protein JHK86_018811 [Glycine max]